MKKIAVFLSILLCVCILFASCGGGSNIKFKETAVEGYDAPFHEHFVNYIKKLLGSYVSDEELKNDEGIPQYAVYWYNEWKGAAAPSNSILKKDETPVMCAAAIKPNGNKKMAASVNDLAFYFIYSEAKNAYTTVYAVSYGDDDKATVYSTADTKAMIDEIYKSDRIVPLQP